MLLDCQWVQLPEGFHVLLPAAPAVSLAMAVHWICNFSIGQFFEPTLLAVGQSTVYSFFAAVCVAAVLFAKSSYLPETKGKTLEEIERLVAA